MISEYGVKCNFKFGDRVLAYHKHKDKWLKGRFITFNKYNRWCFWVLIDNATTVSSFEKCKPIEE